MLKEQLESKGYSLILASGSPRRQQFLRDLNLPFEVRLQPVEEVYPDHLKKHEIADYLAVLKANAFKDTLKEKEILITSDTVVWHKGSCLEKPKNLGEAQQMLTDLSGDTHHVITAVCFTTATKQQVQHYTTEVTFRELLEEEIAYYVENYAPFDKAGGYGIQEWIGHIGVTAIKGSYNNVMGLPTHILYKTLIHMVS